MGKVDETEAGRECAFCVSEPGLAGTGARITVSDPLHRYPARVLDFASGSLPTSFQWDQLFGNNSTAPMQADINYVLIVGADYQPCFNPETISP